jgi:hypothetical protein
MGRVTAGPIPRSGRIASGDGGVCVMDVGTLAAALIGARVGQLQMAVAAQMLRMNADNAASVVKVIEAAQQSMDRLANVAAGIGGNLDLSV